MLCNWYDKFCYRVFFSNSRRSANLNFQHSLFLELECFTSFDLHDNSTKPCYIDYIYGVNILNSTEKKLS